VVDAAVQGDVDAEGQEAHAVSLSHAIARGHCFQVDSLAAARA